MNLLEQMRQRYPEMTATEKKIYHVIMDNVTLFSLRPIGDVASEMGISSTTLMRFAKNLGFDGYSSFKKSLQREEILGTTASDRLKQLKKSEYVHSLEKILNAEKANLDDIVRHLDPEQVHRVGQMMLEAKKILLVGEREQFFLAQIFAFRLRGMGLRVEVLSKDLMDLREGILGQEDGRILLIFDSFPYSQQLYELARKAQEKEIPVILFTDYPTAPLVESAKEVFMCTSKTDYLMNSLNSALFLLNVLVSDVFSKRVDFLTEYLGEREKLREE